MKERVVRKSEVSIIVLVSIDGRVVEGLVGGPQSKFKPFATTPACIACTGRATCAVAEGKRKARAYIYRTDGKRPVRGSVH